MIRNWHCKRFFGFFCANLGHILSAFLIAAAQTVAAQPSDLFLHGGKIATLDKRAPAVQAIAIRGDRILAIGSDAEMLVLAGPQTKTIDLAGRMAMPGFIQCHGHFLSLGDSNRKLDITKARSWDEIVALVALESK